MDRSGLPSTEGSDGLTNNQGGEIMAQIWTDSMDQRLKDLRKEGYSQQQTAEKLSKEFRYRFTRCSIKNREREFRLQNSNNTSEAELPVKETIEIMPDGSHKSEKLLEMSSEQAKDIDYLLKAHGFDREVWELVSARNNIWNTYSKQDGIQTLYSSKITVRPKADGYSLNELIEVIHKEVKPVAIKKDAAAIHEKRLLEIPIFDSHFPISDSEYYQPTQAKIMNLLSRNWEEVLFVLGQDMLHNDNFRGQTAKGTIIEKVDMVQAWEEARKFLEPMIEKAIKQSMKVKIIYSKGNHDESMSWAFIQMLKARYQQVLFDDSFEERKAHVFNQVFIGVTHGDKAKKNLHNLFPVEFPLEWSQAKTREIHTGHLHREDANDIFGMMVRTLATRNKTDQWNKENGFNGAHKRFMLFEYSEEELESIHYV